MRATVVLMALLVVACGSDSRAATQVLVRISAEGAALDANTVRVRVLGGLKGKLAERRVVDIEVANGWPIEIAIEPIANDAARMWKVEAWALSNNRVELGAGTTEGVFTQSKLTEHAVLLKPGIDLGKVPDPTDDQDSGVDGGGSGGTGGDNGSDGGGTDAATDGGGGAGSDAGTDGGLPIDECADVNVCTSDYPCEDLSSGYTCRGQFAAWEPTASPAFIDNADGTITDPRSSLVWQQTVDANSFSWADANTYCAGLSLAGSGWRLPTRVELVSIVDDTRSNPAIDPTAFPSTPAEDFWSSSRDVVSSGNRWFVNFNDGATDRNGSTVGLRVRCIR